MIVALTLFIVLGLWAAAKIVFGLFTLGLFTKKFSADKTDEETAKSAIGCGKSLAMFSGGAVQMVIAVIGIIATTW